MPERVTKEERLVSLAIEKARKVKQELNAKNVEPTQVRVVETDPEPVKIKRPKAVNVKPKNQTQKKEGYGLGGETTEHKIKKAREHDRKSRRRNLDALEPLPSLESIKEDIDGNLGVLENVAEMYFRDKSASSLRALEKDLSAIAKRYN